MSQDRIVVKGAAGCVAFLVLVIGWIAFISWIIMVVFGVIAVNVGWDTISYWTAVLVSILLTVIGGFFRGNK